MNKSCFSLKDRFYKRSIERLLDKTYTADLPRFKSIVSHLRSYGLVVVQDPRTDLIHHVVTECSVCKFRQEPCVRVRWDNKCTHCVRYIHDKELLKEYE